MTNQEINELALQAWKDSMGDALTAVKLLRDRTDLGLCEAGKYIERTAHQFAATFAREKAALAQEKRENEHGLQRIVLPVACAKYGGRNDNHTRHRRPRASRGVLLACQSAPRPGDPRH
jgi:hypothetical protein